MEIEDQPWYWGAVDKTVVAQALSKQEDGSFIIKDATAPGNYTLSVRFVSFLILLNIFTLERMA